MSRAFTDVLRDVQSGRFADELTDELRELVSHVRSTGKKGELTIKIKVAKAKGHDTVMTLDADYKTTVPKAERPATIFFATNNNALVSDNPDQKKMEFRDVKATRGEVREVVDPSTGEIKSLQTAAA